MGVLILLLDQDLVVSGERDRIRTDRIRTQHERERVDHAEGVVDVVGSVEDDVVGLVAVDVGERVERGEKIVILDKTNLDLFGFRADVAVHAANAMVLELPGFDLPKLMF